MRVKYSVAVNEGKVKDYKLKRQKNLDKYNLKVGQQFDSCSALAEYCNVSSQSVSVWMKKGWVE